MSAGFRTITVSIGASSSSCSDATGDWLVYLQGGISFFKNSHTLNTPIHCNTSELSWHILLVHTYYRGGDITEILYYDASNLFHNNGISQYSYFRFFMISNFLIPLKCIQLICFGDDAARSWQISCSLSCLTVYISSSTNMVFGIMLFA